MGLFWSQKSFFSGHVALNPVLAPAARVLVVQATGWGKSAVYWAATSALRAQGKASHALGKVMAGLATPETVSQR